MAWEKAGPAYERAKDAAGTAYERAKDAVTPASPTPVTPSPAEKK